VTLGPRPTIFSHGKYIWGFSPQFQSVSYSPGKSARLAADDCWRVVTGTATALKGLFSSSQQRAQISGPVGIVRSSQQALQIGFNWYLQLLGLISMSLALLNLLPAHVYPRATEHIPEMVDLAERLVDAGHAYLSDAGNIYYSVASFEGYGALSGNTLDALRAGHRGAVEPDKRDPADFALWKAAGEGRLLKWPTPRWGEGYPGWHLECSAMALRHLGPRFDVHSGGVDNVFPHHEDEIAQSAPVVGGPPARIWVHGEFLQVGGRKMAKSAGNIERIAEVAARGIDPLAFRYLCLTSRYRHKLEYTDASLAGAAAGLASLRAGLAGLGPAPTDDPWAAPTSTRLGSRPWASRRRALRAPCSARPPRSGAARPRPRPTGSAPACRRDSR